MVRIGCSGWNYAEWRGLFYPQKGCPTSRWLEYYAGHFDTVEVNSTFYRLARPEVVARWLEQTPDDFTFSPKLSRYITHIKRLAGLDWTLPRYLDSIRPLIESPKLGPMLWQLPANFHRSDERLGEALEQLPPGRHAFEFRHASWFHEDVYAALRSHGAALVIGDHPERPFQAHELTSDFTFIRFHYGHRGRGGNYSKTELEEWRRRIEDWSRDVDVFAYFNNDWKGYAIRNALWLRRRMS